MPETTASLFGAPETWADLQIELNSVHPLWGGQIIRLSGPGHCSVRRVAPGKTFEQRYSFALSAAETRAIFHAFMAHDVCAIAPDHTTPIAPDTVANQITISRGERSHQLLIWGDHPQDPILRELLNSLVRLKALTSGMTAVYVGPYRES